MNVLMSDPIEQKVAPTGIRPLKEAAHLQPSELPQLFLEFEATQTEPAVEEIFIATGGTLAGAAARGRTDFAVSGSRVATDVKLNDRHAMVVRLELPENLATQSTETPYTIDLDNRSKMLVCTSRDGAAINGSVVSAIAGQGAEYLANIFKSSTGYATLPLNYASWLAHTATVSTANMRIVDASGRRYGVNFVDDPKRDEVLKHAEGFVSAWAEGAWGIRTGDNGLRYPYSPTLTKAVAKQPVGINDSGYDLVHNAIEMQIPYSYQTLNSLLSGAIQLDLEFIPEDISKFLGETKVPGKKAAMWGRALASCLSMLATSLVNYRADGRTRIVPEGSEAVAAESWLRQPPRSPLEANDCDGSAILTTSLARACATASADVLSEHEYINAARNILVPHYQVGVTVLGASAGEASSLDEDGAGGGDKHQAMAGHAATIMIPTLSLLRALEKGGTGTVGGNPVLEASKRGAVAKARFNAMFSAKNVAGMPEDEIAELSSWDSVRNAATELQAYAVEGTTPASPLLHVTGKKAEKALADTQRDAAAFAKAAPNVGRSIKVLYVGGADESSPHRFYHDFVEFNLGRSNPLWSDPAIRATGCAATQFVLAKEPNADNSITVAGATPRELVQEQYSAVPLVAADLETANVLDYASKHADLDVMAPRSTIHTLDKFQSEQLQKSLSSLKALDEALKTDEPTSKGHTVAYVVAYATLVNNPAAVQHLCTQIKNVAVTGMVDALDVVGLAKNAEGAEAGKLVVINACIGI